MRTVLACVILLWTFGMALPAYAELGQNMASVATDRIRLKARIASEPHSGYTDNILETGGGTTVHEYTTDDGMVFAVSWQGPKRPDLKQLFGKSYFDRFQADNTRSASRIHMRRALASSHTDFVVRTGGYSGASWGYAILPGLTPATFTPQEFQ